MSADAARPNGPSRSVIVLGMHRSGTSVLAKALESLGVDLGTSLLAALPDNPKGFFEDTDILALNDRMLRRLDRYWDTVTVPPADEGFLHEFVPQCRALIREKGFSRRPLWGFKDPRVTRLLPVWLAALEQSGIGVSCVLANRNPLSIADSLNRRDAMHRDNALLLWLAYQFDGLTAVREHGGLCVDYDVMMADPVGQLETLAGFLGLPAGRGEIEESPFVKEFLDPNLRHSQHGVREAGSGLARFCLDFYEGIRRIDRFETDDRARAGVLDGLLESVSRFLGRRRRYLTWMDRLDFLMREDARYRRGLRRLGARCTFRGLLWTVGRTAASRGGREQEATDP